MKKNIPLFIHQCNDFTGSTKVLRDILLSEYADYEQVEVMCSDRLGNGFLSGIPNLRIIAIPMLKLNKKTIPHVSYFCYIIVGFFMVLWHSRRYSTLYLNTITPAYAALAGRLMGKKLIYHVHEKFQKRGMAVRLMEWTFNRVKAHHIFVSNYTKQGYPERRDCTWEIKYNKLSPEFVNKVEVVPIASRPHNRVVMIGSMSKAKGVDVFVEVARMLPQYQFTMILSSVIDAINEFFADTDIPSNLTLVPSQSDVHPFYKANDLIVNLSNPFFGIETFGLTILEGMAYGLPAVVPNVGGPIELVTDGHNGHTVDTTDVSSVAAAIDDILSDSKRYAHYAENALENYRRFA